MNGLVNLSEFLKQTGTSDVEQVIFDLNQVINTEQEKFYPLVFWDLSTMKFKADTRKQKRTYTIMVYAIQKYIPEERSPSDSKIKAWDELYDAFDSYLNYLLSIEANYSYSIIGLEKLNATLYDKGMISVDEEVGIGIEIEIDAFC